MSLEAQLEGIRPRVESLVVGAAGRALAAFRDRAFRVDRKPDGSLVTDVDVAVEVELRRGLEPLLPGAGFRGEETGTTGPAEWSWIVDPIDGTLNFAAGVPLFATLVALLHDGEPELAWIRVPALGETWTARRGHGAYLDGRRLAVAPAATLAGAFVLTGSPETFQEKGLGEGWLRLLRAAGRYRTYGDFFGYTLLARGAVQAMVEAGAQAHDLAAPMLLVEEAGGRFTDLAGRRTCAGGSGVATAGPIHERVLALVAGGAER